MTQPANAGTGTLHRPAVYMPSGQPLPYYARQDLAYVDGVYHGAAPKGSVWVGQTVDGFLQRTLFGNFTILSGPTVADRYPRILFLDQYNAVVWQTLGETSFPANTQVQITFGTQFTAPAFADLVYTLPIPDTVMQPGAQIFYEALNFQADDTVTQLNYYRILIPTGPPIEDEINASVQPIPTPLIV